jgi:hypothetical protein
MRISLPLGLVLGFLVPWLGCPAVAAETGAELEDFGGNWGGPGDGKVRGRPKMLALNVDHGLQTTGALLFDDLCLVNAQEEVTRVRVP